MPEATTGPLYTLKSLCNRTVTSFMPVRAFSGKYPNCDVGYGGVWLGERFWNGVAILTRECDPVARLLAFVTGLVNQELLLCDGYLAAENRVLRAHLPSRLRLSDAERSTLAEIAKRLGRKALKDIARVAKPDTLLALVGVRCKVICELINAICKLQIQ